MSQQSSHQSLYRKYRPQSLSEVRGQEHITTLFSNILASKKVGHAYLFAGGRGSGKTSVARIIARELGTSPEDIYEIDAASNRGIDEIRAIREGAQTMPFSSAYKVYILDEAHMLTPQAANALLKTLEEPPAHCIFILATTDKDKLPATIRSRCQVLEFKRATLDVLTTLVIDISTAEGYTLESGVAEHIAAAGDGSYRDTLSMLEKLYGSAESNNITITLTEQILQTPKSDFSPSILSACFESSSSEALQLLRALGAEADPSTSIELLLSGLRTALLLRFDTAGVYEKTLSELVSHEHIQVYKKIGTQTQRPITSNTIVRTIELYDLSKRAGASAGLVLELVVIELSGGLSA
jgi:DNA polymerase III subunit gamma/tau